MSRAELTMEQRKTAAEDAKKGMSNAELVKKYGFTKDTARYYIDRYLHGKNKKGKKGKKRAYNILPKDIRESVLEAAKTMTPAELVQVYNISERHAQDYVRKVRGTSRVAPQVVQHLKPALPAHGLKPVLQTDRISVTSDGSTIYVAIPSAVLKARPDLLNTLLC